MYLQYTPIIAVKHFPYLSQFTYPYPALKPNLLKTLPMISAMIRLFLAFALIPGIFISTHGQSKPVDNGEKPYSILTSGKKITIKSKEDIKSIMVWTASGHRILEQKEVNNSMFSFTISVNEKIFFIMMELKGEKRYSEKIGVP